MWRPIRMSINIFCVAICDKAGLSNHDEINMLIHLYHLVSSWISSPLRNLLYLCTYRWASSTVNFGLGQSSISTNVYGPSQCSQRTLRKYIYIAFSSRGHISVYIWAYALVELANSWFILMKEERKGPHRSPKTGWQISSEREKILFQINERDRMEKTV